MPMILTSLSGVSMQNIKYSSYFEILFANTNTNLYNDGVIVIAHVVDLGVSSSNHNWVHIEELYVAKYWFSMNDLYSSCPLILVS